MYKISNLNSTHNPTKQRGVAALAVGLILLFTATIITIFAAKVGLQEQRISGNEYRSKLAFEAAEAGLNFGQYYFKANKVNIYPNATNPNAWTWNRCDGNTVPTWRSTVLNNLCQGRPSPNDWLWTQVPPANTVQPAGTTADNTLAYQVYYLTRDDTTRAGNQPLRDQDQLQVTVVSEGTSDSVAGNAFSKVDIANPSFIAKPDAPIIAAGTVGGSGSGNFEIVTNPNGGGKGVPLSIWSRTNVDIIGNSTLDTCYPHEYYQTGVPYIYNQATPADKSNHYTFSQLNDQDIVLCDSSGGGQCSCSRIVNNIDILTSTNPGGSGGREGIDILDRDNNTQGANPDDTSFPPDLFQYLFGIPNAQYQQRKDSATIIPNCSTSNLNASSSGFYWVEGNCSINGGDIGTPVSPVLVVVEGGVSINGSVRFFGILYAWTADGATGSTVSVNGCAQFSGALIMDRAFNPGGGPQIVYNDKVLINLRDSLRAPSKIPGSWTDYQN